MKKLIVALLLVCPMALAKTLTSIALLPPADGYHVAATGDTIQLTPQCTYDDLSVDACTGITLTWGSGDPTYITVNSSGLGTRTSATPPEYTSPDIYAFSAANPTVIAGHHSISIDNVPLFGLASLPETTSSQIVVGSTVVVSAYDISGGARVDCFTTSSTDGNYGCGLFCAWTTSNAGVASVNHLGEVTGVSTGTATITCTLAGQTVGRTVTVTSPTQTLSTWYVRPNGGTRYDANVTSGQCSGLVNADYPGSGTNQPCAFNNPMYLFTDESSSSVYTGAVESGDTAIIYPSATPYNIIYKTLGSISDPWVTNQGSAITIPSGTPAHPTKIVGSCYPNCSSDPDHAVNRPTMLSTGNVAFVLWGAQNVIINGIDVGTGVDCDSKSLAVAFSFPCPGDVVPYIFMSDSFASNVQIQNTRTHGAFNGWTGTAGPGLVWTNSSQEMGTLNGLNLDDPYGFVGNALDGFQFINSTSAYNGFSEEQPKPLTSVSRDGAGNLNVTFAAGAMVNYVVGTNLTLTGMTPSDMNGTFPVTSVTFDQQTVNITGGTCQAYVVIDPENCTFTTSSAPTFGIGAFGKLTGVTTADGHTLDGTYEVNTVTGTGFTIFASQVTRPNWPNSLTATAISSGGTFGTATSLVAAASGSAESASVVGTALHVIPAHRGIDQNAGGYGNGDCVGTGTYDFGIFIATGSRFIDCTQDGWDMLHSSMAQSIYTFNKSNGNMGAPAKFGNADIGLYQNNPSTGNGQAMMAFNPDFPPDYNQYLSLFYRAGDTLPVAGRLWSHMNISNNTFDTGFPTIIDSVCDDNVGCDVQPTISSFTVQNNIFLGFIDDNIPGGPNGNYPGVICNHGCNGTAPQDPLWVYTNNMGFNIHNPPSTGTGNQWTTNPAVVTMIPNITTFDGEVNALTFDMHLQSSSPAIGAGAENAFTPSTDYAGNTRPNPPSIGAYEFATDPSTSVMFSGGVNISGGVQF